MEGWSLALAMAVGVYDVFVKRLKDRGRAQKPPVKVRTYFDIEGDGDVDSFEFLRFLSVEQTDDYNSLHPGYDVYHCKLDRPATYAVATGANLIFRDGSQKLDMLTGNSTGVKENTLEEIQ